MRASPAPNRELELIDHVANFVCDPYGYVNFAFPWGQPGPLVDQTGPDDWQREQLMRIGEAFAKDPGATVQEAIVSGHGIGKAQPYSFELDTPAGRRKWGDLQVGDYVFGSSGQPVRITARHEQGIRPIYRVTFNDGSSTLVDADHNWSVKGRQDRRNGRDFQVLTTAEILSRGVKRPNGVAMARQWEIPAYGTVQFPKALQPLDPYILGVWLGDGTKANGSITSPDDEIWQEAVGAGYAMSTNRYTGGGITRTHTLYGLQTQLKQIGVFGCTGATARVPYNYRYASHDQRLSILQGLLDTDGWVEKNGTIVFGSISKDLVSDVVWLARSLGMVAREPSINVNKYYRNSDGEKVYGKLFHIVSITWDGFTRVFRLTKKALRLMVSEPRYRTRWIDSIEYSHDEQAMCITVDAADSLYLTNDFIVTHNTAEVAWVILWAMSTQPRLTGWVTANTQNQLTSKTWRELSVWHDRAINKHWFRWTATRFCHIASPDTWGITAIPWTENNSEAFAGTHNQSMTLMIMDESSAISDKIWEVSQGGMTDPRAIWLAYGNPTKNTGRFRECFGKYKHRWTTRQIDSRTCKMTNKAELQRWLDDNGEDSDFFRIRVRGEFPRHGTGQLISAEDVTRARLNTLTADEHVFSNIVIGVDVARYGADETVMVVRQGRKIIDMKYYRALNNIQVGARAAELYRNHNSVGTLLVDEVGLGAGVVDYLITAGYPCIGVNAGAKADNDKRFYNKRAEMWYRMKEWFDGSPDIPDDPILGDQCSALEYEYDMKERVKLETKDTLKERLPALGSPDRADALALTFAEVIPDGRIVTSFEPEDESFE